MTVFRSARFGVVKEFSENELYVQGGFLTGPPDFQYQNEKQVAANQD